MTRELHDRKCRVAVGPAGEQGRAWPGGNDGLRISFDVKKVPNKSTNKATISIYQLKADSRDYIQSGMKVELTAGYANTQQGIFFGDIKRVNRPSSPDSGSSDELKTTIEAGDGAKALEEATINKSFGEDASPENIVSSIGDKVSEKGGVTGGFQAAIGSIDGLKNGYTASGKARNELDNLFAGTDYDWSIQDEQLEIVGPDGIAQTGIVVLSYDSGLLQTKRLENNRIEARSLLMGRIKPNRQIELESKIASGRFRALEVQHKGDTHGKDWNTISTLE